MKDQSRGEEEMNEKKKDGRKEESQEGLGGESEGKEEK